MYLLIIILIITFKINIRIKYYFSYNNIYLKKLFRGEKFLIYKIS
jgi:hypothetical protein